MNTIVKFGIAAVCGAIVNALVYHVTFELPMKDQLENSESKRLLAFNIVKTDSEYMGKCVEQLSDAADVTSACMSRLAVCQGVKR